MSQYITALVAEDNDHDYELLKLALEAARVQWKIQRAYDGVEALEYLRGDNHFSKRRDYPVPQVIVLDLKMPRMTGLELLKWIKENPTYRRTPTLVMSSSRDDRDVEHAYDFGANTYFVKPRNFDELVRLCKQIGEYWDQGVHPSGVAD